MLASFLLLMLLLWSASPFRILFINAFIGVVVVVVRDAGSRGGDVVVVVAADSDDRRR